MDKSNWRDGILVDILNKMQGEKRIVFLDDPRDFFIPICTSFGGSWKATAAAAAVSLRTLSSWRSRKTTMPYDLAREWSHLYGISLPAHTQVDLQEIRRSASVKGGNARQQLHGDVGTPEGRRKGGMRSLKTHRSLPDSPFAARAIRLPRKTVDLAEFFGALIGDGHIATYFFSLYAHGIDEQEYAAYVAQNIQRFFNVSPMVLVRRKARVIEVRCMRKAAVDFLVRHGLCRGNKTAQQASVPEWICTNTEFSAACLRGLIDTDGCVYTDTHMHRKVRYDSKCIAFTNASKPVLHFVQETLLTLGYHPTCHGRHIRLRRKAEVARYVHEIGFKNPKHLLRFEL